MKKILISIFCLTSTVAFSAEKSFDLNMEVTMNGEYIFSPHVVVKDGEKKTLIHETASGKKFVEVLAKDNKGAIFTAFVVGTIDKDGTKTIVSAPRILAMPNQKSQISMGEDGKPEAVSISVTANQITK